MLETVEVRWFFPGKLPREVRKWHEGLGDALADEPERTDIYLRTRDMTAIGTKLRQGSLQLKARQGKPMKVKLSTRATATLATWRKWNFSADDNDSVTEPLFHDTANWVRVRKKRQQHYFCWHKDRGFIDTRGEADATCGLELSTVRVAGKTWWSLAMEAAAPAAGNISGGPPKRARQCVLAVAQRVFAAKGAPKCPLKRSLSYPEWLAKVTKR